MQKTKKLNLNLALAMLLGRFLPPAAGLLDRQARTLRRRRAWAESGCGEREKARRVRQMAAGVLRDESRGLR